MSLITNNKKVWFNLLFIVRYVVIRLLIDILLIGDKLVKNQMNKK